MKLKEDVRELVKKLVVEESVAAVWKRFDTVLQDLGAECEILVRFLKGETPEVISKAHGLTPDQVKSLIAQQKQQAIQKFRQTTRVKQ